MSLVNIIKDSEKFKSQLNTYNKDYERNQDELSKLDNLFQSQTTKLYDSFFNLRDGYEKEIIELCNLSDFIINKECLENELKIDVTRFSNVMDKTTDCLLDLKGNVQEMEFDVQGKLPRSEKQKSHTKSKAAKPSSQILTSRQTQKPFFYAIMEPGSRYRCISCNEAMTIHCPYLRHVEEYPAASNLFKPHSYHVKQSCVLARGFQAQYLSKIKVVCEVEVNAQILQSLVNIGFTAENIQTKSDSERTVSTGRPFHANDTVNKFVLKRKDNKLGDKVVCVSCNCDIRPDSYLARGHDNGPPIHIKKDCIQSASTSAIDFANVKCFVSALLRNQNELNQLLSCGFLEHRIIGHRPSKLTSREISHGAIGIAAPQMPPLIQLATPLINKNSFFVYRRNDFSVNNYIICIGCRSQISDAAFITFGDSFTHPLHIKKDCLLFFNGGIIDFSPVKCRVFSLLKNHDELIQLISAGFYYMNIIGVRPQNPNIKPGTTIENESNLAPPVNKNVGFIFNEEPFCCERLTRKERCEGCTQFVKKGDFALRHRERIPREKLVETPLVSQYYHATNNCLLKRCFTDKFLEFALCHAVLSGQDNIQFVRSLLVKCGFSGDNIRMTESQSTRTLSPINTRAAAAVTEPADQCLHIVNCSKSTAHCGGCGFNIALNEACFLYGVSAVQDANGKLFHLKKRCLEDHFTKTEMLSLQCINNNSIADVDAETIVKCGVMNIRTVNAGTAQRRAAATMPDRRGALRDGERVPPAALLLPVHRTDFIVNALSDRGTVCTACARSLQSDRYVLQAISSDDSPSRYMHLSKECVRGSGFSREHLSRCDVVLSVEVTDHSVQVLRQCGFVNINK